MHPIFQNKFVRLTLAILGVLAVIFVLLLFLMLSSSSRGLGTGGAMMDASYAPSAPAYSNSVARDEMMADGEMATKAASSYYMPEPVPSGYTADLESYETTQYSVTARTKEFDELCDTIADLKTDPQIHFKYLNESTNVCRSTFYVDEEKADDVLATLTAFRGVEATRNTESITRHRQQVQGQTDILEQQLASVGQSLTMAETQFDELAEFARQSKDAVALSEAIRYKLQNIDTLTQRKINLTAQLNNLYQQAADIEERLGVVEFAATINRSNPIYPEQESRKWERAWDALHDAYTDTLINLTAFFGVFLLWVVQAIVYLLVLIVLLRGLWKFAKLLWRKW